MSRSSVVPVSELRDPGAFRLLRAEDLALDVFSPRTARRPAAAAAYALWHEIWLSTLRQLDGISYLDSNEFARQDRVLALTHEDRCVAVTGLRSLDRSTRIGQEDSYFRPWPCDVLDQLGPLLAISSNTVVAEDFRRARVERERGEPQRLSELTIALAVRWFLDSRIPEFVGVVRNDRRMDEIAATLGFRAIGRIKLHGEESDIMRLRHGTRPAFGREVEDVWARRRAEDDHG